MAAEIRNLEANDQCEEGEEALKTSLFQEVELFLPSGGGFPTGIRVLDIISYQNLIS